MDFFYNDRFEMVFGGTFDPKPRNKLLAIEQGLPNPMIVVAEYMDTFGGGFKWGLAIPAAGYYGKIPIPKYRRYCIHGMKTGFHQENGWKLTNSRLDGMTWRS